VGRFRIWIVNECVIDIFVEVANPFTQSKLLYPVTISQAKL